MSGRPDPSNLFLSNPFGNAAGPFDPELARERAKQLVGMLSGHKMPEGSTPLVLGAELAQNLEIVKPPHSPTTSMLTAALNIAGLGHGPSDPEGYKITAEAIASLLRHQSAKTGNNTGTIVAEALKARMK